MGNRKEVEDGKEESSKKNQRSKARPESEVDESVSSLKCQ